MTESGHFDGPVRAVVTGASSGIGRAAATRLVARGAHVALWARRETDLKALESELGETSVAIPCDVSNPEDVDRALTLTEERIGMVNALVSAAGIADPRPLAQLDAEAWAQTIDVNLSGTFYPCRAVGLRLQAARAAGSIVTIGSELSSFAFPHYTAYCASKFGVVGLTKALAAELAPCVRVNTLCPGPVDTPMLAYEFSLTDDPGAARAAENKRPPLQRIAQPDEIADAVVWLLWDATFATGALVPIDGGTTAI